MSVVEDRTTKCRYCGPLFSGLAFFGVWWFSLLMWWKSLYFVITLGLLSYLVYSLFLGPFVPKKRKVPVYYVGVSIGVWMFGFWRSYNAGGQFWLLLIWHIALIYVVIEAARFALKNRAALAPYFDITSASGPSSESVVLYNATRGALLASCVVTTSIVLVYALPQIIHIPKYYTRNTVRPNWTYHGISGKRYGGVGMGVRAHQDFSGGSVYQLVIVNYRKRPLNIGELSFRLIGMNGARYAPFNSRDESQDSSTLNPGMRAIIDVGFHTGTRVVGNYLIVSGTVVPISH